MAEARTSASPRLCLSRPSNLQVSARLGCARSYVLHLQVVAFWQLSSFLQATMSKKYSQHFRAEWLKDPNYEKWLRRVEGDDTKCVCKLGMVHNFTKFSAFLALFGVGYSAFSNYELATLLACMRRQARVQAKCSAGERQW